MDFGRVTSSVPEPTHFPNIYWTVGLVAARVCCDGDMVWQNQANFFAGCTCPLQFMRGWSYLLSVCRYISLYLSLSLTLSNLTIHPCTEDRIYAVFCTGLYWNEDFFLLLLIGFCACLVKAYTSIHYRMEIVSDRVTMGVQSAKPSRQPRQKLRSWRWRTWPCRI